MGLDAVTDPRSVHVAADEARLLEDLEVLGDGRLRQGKLLDDVAADASALAEQDANDLHARGVPERLLSARLGTIVNAESEEWNKGARARMITDQPAHVLAGMAGVAEKMGTQLSPWVSDVDAMGHLLRRLIADISA